MNFNLTEQQQQIVDQVREFTAQRLAPGVLERDEQQVFPVEAFKEFGAMGMFGLCYPKEFGGTDVGYLPYILAVEEVSKVDSSFGIGFSVNPYTAAASCIPPLRTNRKNASSLLSPAARPSAPSVSPKHQPAPTRQDRRPLPRRTATTTFSTARRFSIPTAPWLTIPSSTP